MKRKIIIPVENPVLSLALLGTFDAKVGMASILDAGYAKLRGLLAFLAMSSGNPLRREFLADLFWPNMSIAAARKNLRLALFNLKSAMDQAGPLLAVSRDAVTLGGTGLWLDALDFDGATDLSTGIAAHNLEQMEYQASLYRGEFMDGFSLPDCPEFEGWLQLQRTTMHVHILVLLERLSNCHEQHGDFSRALQFALRHIRLEPWNEDANRRVMRLHALNGQKGAAIAQFEAYCFLLKKELGALPGEETRRLAESIGKGELKFGPTAIVWHEPDKTASHSTVAASGQLAGCAEGISAKPVVPNQVEGATPAAVKSISQPQAERRQVTVLYCELVPAGTDDPDEAMELLQAPQAHGVKIIRRFSGHVVQTHGGGLLAYFGFPHAREDAARHAVQAALALIYTAAHGIEIRAGIHTGIIITSGDVAMPDKVGKTSRLAIQLCQSIASSEVAISQETHHLVGGYFNCLGLGAQAMPGYTRPLEVFKVIASSGARSRLDASAQLTPLVGRHAEITMLLALWGEAARGKRNLVLIQGEAGIGKSRILHTLKTSLMGKPHAIRELRCFSEFSQSPFYPVIELLKSFYGFAHGDTPAMKSAKLAQHMARYYPMQGEDAVALLIDLLSLPHNDLYPAPVLSPQKHRERTISILLAMLQELATRQPVLFVVEDLHWVDPSTLELLSLFVAEKQAGSILSLFTARPEFDPPWNEALETTLTLSPLTDMEVAQTIDSLDKDIPAATARLILARSDGIPLFVEEMTKIVSLENQIGIPATLHDLLAARMDSLGEAKSAAQLASTIGRQFDLDLLRKISPEASVKLAHSISILEDSGLILKTSETGRQFKHALIQEAAYQSQIKADRQAAHISIARALQKDFSDIVGTQPEVIAQHFNAGGDARQAIEYWLRAAERTTLYSVCTEELGYLQSGLDALGSLPDDAEKDRLEFALQLRHGFAMQTHQGYGANSTVLAFHQAIELARKIGNIPGLFQALLGLNAGLSSHPDFNNTSGLAIAGQLLDIAQESNDPYLHQQASYSLGSATFWMGDFAASRLHHEQSISLDPPNPQDIKPDYTNKICSVSSQSFLSWILWFQGFPEQAQHVSELSVARARQFASPHTLLFALTYAATLQGRLKNIDASLALAEECILLAQKIEFPLFILSGMLRRGWCQAMQGKTEGLMQIKTCVERMRKRMGGIIITFNAVLAEALLHHGQAEEALSVVNESLCEGRKKNDHHMEAELHRFKGEALMQLGRGDEARACFTQALDVSRKQGAKALELRAAMSIARL